jgi:hypothetical protein
VVPLTEPLTDFPLPASGRHPTDPPHPATGRHPTAGPTDPPHPDSGRSRAAELPRPFTGSPLPVSDDSSAAVVQFPFSGTGDERSTATPGATHPGLRPAEPRHLL